MGCRLFVYAGPGVEEDQIMICRNVDADSLQRTIPIYLYSNFNNQEKIMINVTEAAQNELTTYFDGKEIRPIRIHLADGGCSGMKLSLALDELRDGDKSVEQGAFTFLINEELSEAAGKVSIDMSEYGFTIASEKEIGGGGGCSGCSCGC